MLPPPAVCRRPPARGVLPPSQWWGEPPPVEHAALQWTGPERLVGGRQAGFPASCADLAPAALRAHPPDLHCAVHPARRPLWAPYRARLVLPADPHADCVDRAGPDCHVTQGPDPVGQRPARWGDLRVPPAARAALEPRPAWMERAGSATGQWGVPWQTSPVHSNLPVGFVL